MLNTVDINNQLGRRNLTPEQASYLRGQRYNREKRQDGGHGDQKSGGQNVRPKLAADRLASEYGVNERTIRRDGEFATAVDALAQNVGEQARQVILSGDSRLTKEAVVAVAQEELETRLSRITRRVRLYIMRHSN